MTVLRNENKMPQAQSTWPKRIYTKLKFVKSQKTDAVIGFISQNNLTKKYVGVREESEYPKKICILGEDLIPKVKLNALYDVTLVRMKEKDGYVAIEATPTQFPALIETDYQKNRVYRVTVKFGNKTIVFDPVGGKKPSRKDLDKCREMLAERIDIYNLPQVISDFTESATKLVQRLKSDGYYYKS